MVTPSSGSPQADCRLSPLGLKPRNLFQGQGAAASAVWSLPFAGLFPSLRKFLGSSSIKGRLCYQLICVFAVEVRSLGLVIRSFRITDVGPLSPKRPRPPERGHEFLCRVLDGSFRIGVLNTEDELPSVMPCIGS